MADTPPQIAPFVFSEPQERALNDALGRVAGAITSVQIRVSFTAEATEYTFNVSMPMTTYGVAVDTTWWTMTKPTLKTKSKLTLAFSNPAMAGDVLVVTLT